MELMDKLINNILEDAEMIRRSRHMEKIKTSPVVYSIPKPNRNDPCPCESGLKYKKCCLNKKP